MKRFDVHCLVLLLGLVPGFLRADDLPRIPPADAGFSAAGLEKVEARLRESVEKREIAGGVALLVRKGKVAYWQPVGLQDAEAGTPMRQDTLFRIASMTKPITSVAVMILADEGRLRVSDPVARYLPEFENAAVALPDKSAPNGYRTVPAQRPITIHHLLTHTSGVTYGFFDKPILGALYRQAGVQDGLAPAAEIIADNVRRIAKLPLLNQPGEAWEYGLNTDILGRLVEVVSGQDLATFFRDRIFQPLDMQDTFFYVPDDKVPRLAALYTTGPDKKIVRVGEGIAHAGPVAYSADKYYRGPRSYFSGGAGLVSSAADYARFLQMLLDGGERYGRRILKPETVREMTRNQIGDLKVLFPDHGDRFGYGFGIVTPEGKGHDPSFAGSFSWGGIYYTYFWADPQKQLIGVLMTQVYPTQSTLRTEFKKLVYAALEK